MQRKLVALGVTAKIVVVFENEDAGITVFGAIEMRGRQAADATANDDQIVMFAGRIDIACLERETAVAQAVCRFKRARVAAAEPGERRRIITGGILRRLVGGKGRRDIFRE